MKSIHARLIVALLAATIAASTGAGLTTYVVVQEEVNDLLDAQLVTLASSLHGGKLVETSNSQAELADGEENDFVIQQYNTDGTRLASSLPDVTFSLAPTGGFYTVEPGGKTWRLYERRVGEHIVVVAQPQSARNELSATIALSMIWPSLALIPLLGMLIWIAVRTGLKPLDAMAADIGRRNPSMFEPLPLHALPRELVPLISSLNKLMERLALMLQVQREFVEDAAHELRTPLAAVHVQAQMVKRASTELDRVAAIDRLLAGSQRATHLVQQLLTMARQDPATASPPLDSVSLNSVTRLAVADFLAHAIAKRIDLGFVRNDSVKILGDEESLRILIGNLLDNAIRYTPEGGRVDVSIASEDEGDLLTISDTGPGIRGNERDRVLQRFYRLPGSASTGSGLGLAIVKGIAERHSATLALDQSPGGGLRVNVRFSKVTSPA